MLTLYFPIWKANHKDYHGKRQRSKTFLRICTDKLYESTLFDNSTIIYLRKLQKDKSETRRKVSVFSVRVMYRDAILAQVFFFNEISINGIHHVNDYSNDF